MKKLAIAGAQELTRNNAPWYDEDYDIWVISNWVNAEWCKRADAVIEIHTPEVYTDHPKDPNYWNWLQNNQDIPVYMLTVDERVPKAEQYPLEEVKELISTLTWHGKPVKNINSSVDYLMGLALLQGYKDIEVYGVEMAHSSEYMSQQPSFAFWVGVATGLGAKIDLRCTRGLFDKPLYGSELFMDIAKLQEYVEGMKIQLKETQSQAAKIEGAIMFAEQLIKDEQDAEDEPEKGEGDESQV